MVFWMHPFRNTPHIIILKYETMVFGMHPFRNTPHIIILKYLEFSKIFAFLGGYLEFSVSTPG